MSDIHNKLHYGDDYNNWKTFDLINYISFSHPNTGVGNYFCLGATLRRPSLSEGHTSSWEYKHVSIYSLSTSIYYEKLKKYSDLKIFPNASSSHWKRCDGPHLARGPLFAHFCPNISPYPTHLPKHQALKPNHQFSQRIWYVEYCSAHAHMVWSQKFRLTPEKMQNPTGADSWTVATVHLPSQTRGGRSHIFRLRLRSCSKIFKSGNFSNLWIRSDSYSYPGYHQCKRNSAMKWNVLWPRRLLLLPKMANDPWSGSYFSQTFDSGSVSEKKTQNPFGIVSDTPVSWPTMPQKCSIAYMKKPFFLRFFYGNTRLIHGNERCSKYGWLRTRYNQQCKHGYPSG